MNILGNRSKMILAATYATVALLFACGGNDTPTAPSTPTPTPTPAGPWDGVWSGPLERGSSSIAANPAEDRVSFTVAGNAIKTISISWSSYVTREGVVCSDRNITINGTGETIDSCDMGDTCPPNNEFFLHGYRGESYSLDGVGIFNATTGYLRGNVTFAPVPAPGDCSLRLYYAARKQ
jgi:hypothetical protein